MGLIKLGGIVRGAAWRAIGHGRFHRLGEGDHRDDVYGHLGDCPEIGIHRNWWRGKVALDRGSTGRVDGKIVAFYHRILVTYRRPAAKRQEGQESAP